MYYVKYVFAASGGWEERRKKPSTKTTVQGQHKAVKAAQQQPVRRAAQRKDNIDFLRHYFGLFWFVAGLWPATQLCLYGNLAYLIQYMAGCW